MNDSPNSHPPIDRLVQESRVRGTASVFPDGTDAEAVTREGAERVVAAVLDYIAESGMSRRAVARAIGVSTSTLGMVLSWKYPGNWKQIALDLDRWLEDQEKRDASPRATNFTWTTVPTIEANSHPPIDRLVQESRVRGTASVFPDGTDADAVTREGAERVVAAVLDYIAESGMSRSAIAKAIGVSGSTLGMALNWNYPGNWKQIALDLDRWLEDQEKRNDIKGSLLIFMLLLSLGRWILLRSARPP